MSKLLKNPMGDGSKFWAGDILTSLGMTVDEAVDAEVGSNANGVYMVFPNGFKVMWNIEIPVYYASGSRLNANWTFPVQFEYSSVAIPIAIKQNTQPDVDRGMVPQVRRNYLDRAEISIENSSGNTFNNDNSIIAAAVAIGI